MSNTTRMRQAWHPPCSGPSMTFRFWNGTKITIDPRVAEAVSAMDYWLEVYQYRPEQHHTGAFVCRKITGGSGYSLHAYKIAIDINWLYNPYGPRFVMDMPMPMVDAIEDIRTNNGLRVWRWGGDWDGNPNTPHNVYDTMHFELQVSPSELSVGINQLLPPEPDPSQSPDIDWDSIVLVKKAAIMEVLL